MRIFFVAAIMLLPATYAQAGTSAITSPLFGEVTDPFDPAFGETATGSFTYEPSLLTGSGDEVLGVADGLLVDFTFLGTTFFESDDTDFDFFPTLEFFDGEPVALDFLVIDGDGVGTEIGDPRMDGFLIFGLIPDPTGPGFIAEITTFFIPVPEPAAVALIGLGLCFFPRRR